MLAKQRYNKTEYYEFFIKNQTFRLLRAVLKKKWGIFRSRQAVFPKKTPETLAVSHIMRIFAGLIRNSTGVDRFDCLQPRLKNAKTSGAPRQAAVTKHGMQAVLLE